jgi:CDP-diacylglycerol--serine O-phosphatidyltransferase
MKIKKVRQSSFKNLASIAVSADSISIIKTPKAFKQALLELIEQAKHRIYLTALYLQDDESGAEVLHALYRAKQKNPALEIKVFVDFLRAQRGLMGKPESIGNVRLYRECAKQYEHQIDILGVPIKSKEVFGVLHLKGFFFDEQLLYSGASLNDIYLHKEERYRYDRYHLINNENVTNSMVNFLENYLVDSPSVKSLTQDYIPHKKQLKHLIRKLKSRLRRASYQFDATKISNEKNIAITPMIGFGGRNKLNQAIYELVKNTNKELSIYTPYFNLPSKISRAVRRLLKNNKSVSLVVGDKKANDFYIPPHEPFNRIGVVPYVYESNLRKFIKRHQAFIDKGLLNIYLWCHDDNSFHLKGMSSDQTNYLITGHNINPRAWRLDIENGLIIQDEQQQLKQQFEQEHQQILTHTRRITHFSEIETIADYPEDASKLMKSVKRAKLDSILNRLL